jgi:hypothetical protein
VANGKKYNLNLRHRVRIGIMSVRDLKQKRRGELKMMCLKLKCQVIDCGNGSFGIRFLCGDILLREYKYVTRDREGLNDLSDKINRAGLSPIHIDDVLEDFLP